MKTGDIVRERGRDGAAGFSLIEIAIGVIVLVIALLGLSLAMITAYRVERIATEKRIAMTWATTQVEIIRSMAYSEITAAPNKTPVPGYLVKSGWSIPTIGRRVDVAPADSTPDYFARYYYLPGTPSVWPSGEVTPVTLADAGLAGLRALDAPPPNTSIPANAVGVVAFSEPVTAVSGIDIGTGYFVTVQVLWQGVAGPSEIKMSTFVGK